MSLFKKSPDEMRAELQKISDKTSKSLDAEFKVLKQESVDFSNLIADYALYVKYRQEFFVNPNRDMFGLVERQLRKLQRSLKAINEETHSIEHMLDWMRTQTKYEAQVVQKIKVQGMNVK